MDVSTFKAVAGAVVFFGGIGLYLYRACFKPEKRPEEPQYTRFEPIAKPKPPATLKPIQTAEERPTKPVKPTKSNRANTSPETIEAMHKEADAERAIAEALERKAPYITDPVKRARIEKQAALSWTRFNKILDNIDKQQEED